MNRNTIIRIAIPIALYESVKGKVLSEASLKENYEVHYSDGVKGKKSFASLDKAKAFAKEKINSEKTKEVEIYKASTGFHSTTQGEYLIGWWGSGSYWDNKAKKNPELNKKKLTEANETSTIIIDKKEYKEVDNNEFLDGLEDLSNDAVNKIEDYLNREKFKILEPKSNSKNLNNETIIGENLISIDGQDFEEIYNSKFLDGLEYLSNEEINELEDYLIQNKFIVIKPKSNSKNLSEAKKKPSAGMTKKEKSAVVKKAKAGKDIGKKGKGFAAVEKKAKESGADNPKAVAAAAMWKAQAKKK